MGLIEVILLIVGSLFLLFVCYVIVEKRSKCFFKNLFGCYPPVKKFGTEYDDIQTCVVIVLHNLQGASLNRKEEVIKDKKEIESLPLASPRDIIYKINRLKINKVKILSEEEARNLLEKACELACDAGYEEEAKFFGYGQPTEDDQD